MIQVETSDHPQFSALNKLRGLTEAIDRSSSASSTGVVVVAWTPAGVFIVGLVDNEEKEST